MQKRNKLSGYKFKIDNHIKGFAETDLDKKVMKINKKRNKQSKAKGELLDTITHEMLHIKHPKASEKKIQKLTPRTTSKLSAKQKSSLYGRFKARS